MFNSIDSTCRQIIQGDTYTYITEPYITANFISVEDPDDSTKKIYEKSVVKQWRGIVHYSKVYEYVGLTESAAKSGANSVTNAYTVSVTKWGLGILTITDPTTYKTTARFMMVSIGSGPQGFAEATPVHVAGNMWSLQVRVNATVEMYSQKDGSAPSANQLKGLVSSISSFPES